MNSDNGEKTPRTNILYRIDGFIKRFIPNFNARAILYFSLIFAIALYFQIWRISSHEQNEKPSTKQETIIADDNYWNSDEYKDRIKNQTVESFTKELQDWLSGSNQEFSRRTFEDILLINTSLTSETGGNLDTVVPENFNYLENHAKARYQYAKQHNFLSESPTMITYGSLVCDLDERTEKATNITVYEWRYASMPKLAEFMKSNPDWKIQIGDRILDVSDPKIEDPDFLALKNSQTQPPGLFSFLIFKDNKENRIFLTDSTILENNQIDSRQTFGSLISNPKSPKLYFKYGYEGCRQIGNQEAQSYERFD